ncbi:MULTISPECIES: ATP-binding protein [unclassified Rathayibacter]|uniref:ATP-binding protein n=1 Tax=unclassified Rathayibacter TaxID=2609250 RepID=UPI000CE805EE|nr:MULTISPECIES: ATP-binding protein [unclassified Rathayibacter]PPF18435.1 ATP-binding protein [Rathayibacter sp. AY1A4]PPG83353.1 ATP-binding protein [Rathayibacter sp. AY1E5]PPH30206.1 ATP-binding protein [Rathayibacter sp. AY1C3]PPH61549.1 ATP-binding protein [Rathayibacter sp. AY1D7]PPI31168.1 ATP-binding protein [Rathayibacter sp. AY1B4]
MLPEQNPYSPGSGRRPPELVGRTGELEAFDTIRARVTHGMSDRGIVLTGLRGVGKTVLLNEMHRMAESFEWLTVRLEARRDEGGARAVRRALARELVVSARKLTRSKPTELMREALGTISSFNAKVGATGIELGVALNDGRADSGDAEVDLLELVEDVSTALGERRRAFGVFVDEMQDLDAETMGALIAAQHAANQREWPFYIIAAGLPNLPRVLTETRSYAERLFNYRQIGTFSRDDAAHALREPAERLGAEFAPDALEILLEAAGGYPYFIQEYGQAAWNLSSRLVTLADATAAVQYGTEQLDAGFFRSRWQRATRSERRMLRAMAADGEGPSSTALVTQRMGIPTTSLGPYRAALISKGLVYSPEHGQIAFTVPGMAGYVDRHHEDLDDGSPSV